MSTSCASAHLDMNLRVETLGDMQAPLAVAAAYEAVYWLQQSLTSVLQWLMICSWLLVHAETLQ